MENTEKKQYEMSFILREEEGAKTVAKFVADLGGEIETESPIQKIALAYPIKKETIGFFGFFHFALEPKEVVALEHEMETSQAVLRHLLITPPFKKAEPRVRPEAPLKSPKPAAVKAEMKTESLTNEDLEKKIEEILG